MPKISLKPAHKSIVEFYAALENFDKLNVKHELAVKTPFQNLLDAAARQFGWTLIPEFAHRKKRVDGAVVDQYNLPRGLWEAKDSADDLQQEIKKKFAAGYPSDNIMFQTPKRAILYQNKQVVVDADLTKPDELIHILERFFDYTAPAIEEWSQAATDFEERIQDYGKALAQLIEKERTTNQRFQTAFWSFYELARQSINPNLSESAIEEMLIQHLLTERIFRTVFRNPDFTRRNVIAAEIEKVIDALTSQSFSREDFLSRFDYFYRALEQAAATVTDFGQKQAFLNTVYERFFQGFSVKTADTHGIVYTPQAIVNFMVKSVEEILKKEFGKSLSSQGVQILDPFVGTGNFIVRVMQEIRRTALEHKFKNELHCNEVMLLPYYIASLNIEHEFYELTKSYQPFEGICLVDTFELAEHAQTGFSFMTAENTARVERQKQSPIFVCIGNPPYNVGQLNENDNNKNRKYKQMDKRVAETYAKDSRATNKNALSNVYVKAIRWAADEIKKTGEGIVAFVTNNSFVEKIAFDGMRKHLSEDFNAIYVLDLQGDIRKDSMRDGIALGEKHTVFGLAAMVGISIAFFVKKKDSAERKIFYHGADFRATRTEKFALIDKAQTVNGIDWWEIAPDAKHNWLTEGMQTEFETFLPIGNKETKSSANNEAAIFREYSRGVETSRDEWVFNFNQNELEKNIEVFIATYNEQLFKWQLKKRDANIMDSFVQYDDKKIKWSRKLKQQIISGVTINFDKKFFKNAIYRPFTKQFLYFSSHLVYLPAIFPKVFPTAESENENSVICVTNHSQIPFVVQITNCIPALDVGGRPTQCFPFYVYSEDGANRRENVTDWALQKFREHYAKQSEPGAIATGLCDGKNPVAIAPGSDRNHASITKRDIFNYVYGILHSNTY